MKLKSQSFSILLVIICTFLTATGQFFTKIGADKISENLISILNFHLIFGFFLYGLGAIILIIALKYGKLSILYPILGLGFVWVFLISTLILKESVLLTNWLGLFLIIFGVSFIGLGASNESN